MRIFWLILLCAFNSSLTKRIGLSRAAINHLVNTINQQNATWKATSDNEIRPVMLYEEESSNSSFIKDIPIKKSKRNVYLPNNFDARKKWPYCKSIRSIGDQGNCGSCWAYSTSTAMTDRYCIQNSGKTFTFSIDALVTCCKSCFNINGCKGGSSSEAWKYWTKTGLPSQACKPYTSGKAGKASSCSKSCVNNRISWNKDLKYGLKLYRLTTVRDVQNDLMENGPLTVIYSVYEDFYHYKYGIYKHLSGSYSGRHAVKLVGWGTENGVKYWLLANSWGAKWGENGFFRIRRGTNECDIENYRSLVASKSRR